MNLVVTLSNEKFYDSRIRLNSSAQKFNLKIKSYDFEDIKHTEFYKKNLEVFQDERGMGYWLWKPFIIHENLKSANEGDIIIYIDSGIEIVQPLDSLIDICANHSPILLFKNSDLININWTKRDSYILMNLDLPEFWYAPQVDASICLFKKTDQTLEFIEEWLKFCANTNILTDMPNIYGENFPEFVDHRHDQSVLSLLAQKYKIHLYRIPTQFGNHYKLKQLRVKNEFNCVNQWHQIQVDYYAKEKDIDKQSNYPQLLNHHRGQKIERINSETRSDNLLKMLVKKAKNIVANVIR